MFAGTIGTPLLWLGFLGFVLAMLALDLGVFHRRSHTVRLREAAIWSGVWIALALLFGAGVWALFGAERGLEFLTGWLVEKALSVDNLFVFAVLFGYFAVPPAYQHRVLFWGILGALVMRGAFILAGGAFLTRFHWAVWVFGGILAVTGVRLLVQRDQPEDPGKKLVVRLARRFLPMTDRYDGARLTVVRDGRRYATPLLLALVVIEATDLLFAVDSVPAVLAITSDPFIVFTSNVFAILGLRALYFLLAGVLERVKHLKTGLALVLVFVGAKMVAGQWVKIPVGVSLAVIAALLAGTVLTSLLAERRATRQAHRRAEAAEKA